MNKHVSRSRIEICIKARTTMCLALVLLITNINNEINPESVLYIQRHRNSNAHIFFLEYTI